MLQLSIHLEPDEVVAAAQYLNHKASGIPAHQDCVDAATKALTLLVNQAVIHHGLAHDAAVAVFNRDRATWSRPRSHKLPRARRNGP